MSAKRFIDPPVPLAIAHRGGNETAPENTVASFTAATEQGFTHLETDVHLTKDGVLVAFHDELLDRVTDRTGRVLDLPWSEVSEARIGGTEPIPTMDELLETFPDALFNIDTKTDDAVVALSSALRRHHALDRVCIAAFSDTRLRRIRALLGPELSTAASPREVTALTGSARVAGVTRGRSSRSGSIGASAATPASLRLPVGTRSRMPYACVQVPVRHGRLTIVTPEFIAAVHERGCQVHVWTVDDPVEMHRLLDLGVDGIMTDRPSVLRGVLVERAEWG